MPDLSDFGVSGSEIQFLQSKADAGKLVIVQGSISTTGTVVSYTPASGQTFVLYSAKFVSRSNATSLFTTQLRNNSTVRETSNNIMSSLSGVDTWQYTFITKGDTLVGDGVKIYDVYVSANAQSLQIVATIVGYLE